MADIQPAAIDTSFWTVGHRADVIAYLFGSFTIHVPPGVRGEILATDPRHPTRRYGYAELFSVLEGRGLLLSATPKRVYPRFGVGEAEALALAQEHDWRLLINDHRPLAFADQHGIRTMSVPSFILILYAREVISLAAADRKLDLIESNTSPAIMEPARRVLDRLARRKEQRTR